MGFRCVAPGNRSFNWETIKIARNILAVVRRGLRGGNHPTPERLKQLGPKVLQTSGPHVQVRPVPQPGFARIVRADRRQRNPRKSDM